MSAPGGRPVRRLTISTPRGRSEQRPDEVALVRCVRDYDVEVTAGQALMACPAGLTRTAGTVSKRVIPGPSVHETLQNLLPWRRQVARNWPGCHTPETRTSTSGRSCGL
jgi:hypothetical protein